MNHYFILFLLQSFIFSLKIDFLNIPTENMLKFLVNETDNLFSSEDDLILCSKMFISHPNIGVKNVSNFEKFISDLKMMGIQYDVLSEEFEESYMPSDQIVYYKEIIFDFDDKNEKEEYQKILELQNLINDKKYVEADDFIKSLANCKVKEDFLPISLFDNFYKKDFVIQRSNDALKIIYKTCKKENEKNMQNNRKFKIFLEFLINYMIKSDHLKFYIDN